MERIKTWWRNLPDQWHATIRSSWQTATGFIGVFALAALAEATDLLNGGTLEETLTDLSIAAKAAAVGLVSIGNALVAFWMNRRSAKNAPTYPTPRA